MKKMMKDMVRKLKETKGATAVEYGIMVALIAAVIIVTVSVLGSQVNNAFSTVSSNLMSSGVGT